MSDKATWAEADFRRRFPNWHADTDAYIAAQEQATAEGWRHAYCDHASGYCAG